MNTGELKTAQELVDHYRKRQVELAQIDDIGTALQAVTLTFGGGGNRINITTAADISDSETVRVEIIEAITNILRLSASATRDHLTAMGVEL